MQSKRQLNRSKVNVWLLSVAIVTLLGVGWGQLASARMPAGTARHYTDLEFAPPPEIQIPDYTRFQLENGIVVYLMEDHELPLVSGSATFYTGDRLEPADKVGLASIVGTVMRSGGTKQHPPQTLNQLLEQRAASIETGVDSASGGASFDTLTEDLPGIFGLFAEVIREPAFPLDKIQLAKSQGQGSIARRNDDPDSIAGREFQKLIYGADSPYARTAEYATLASISRADLIGFYQQYFQPNNMILGIVGDFEPGEMRSLIEANFASWSAQAQPSIFLPIVEAKSSGVFLVDQPQLTQSYIQLGHLGGRLSDPDHAALSVLNEVMNGFGGRLVNEVRSRQGLAYTVYAYWSPQFDYPGVFVGGGQTRSAATVPFIRSLLAEIDGVRTAPISEAELTRAKDAVLNAFIFNFQTPAQTLSRLIRYEYYKYPQDFIFRYQRAVETTTVADVQQAAATHLKPENIVTLVVGNNAAIDPPLSTLGQPVEAIDIAIPPDSNPNLNPDSNSDPNKIF